MVGQDTVTKGSCLCSKVHLQYTGPPHENAICHCTDCQKWTGSSYSPCATVPRESFKLLKGTPKRYDVRGGSGKLNKYFFCADCGSSLWNEPDATPQWICVRSGVLDEGAAHLDGKIGIEFYVKDRVAYLGPIKGAEQVGRM